VLGVGVHDLTGGFKCIHRRVLEAIDLPSVRAEGYVFQIEVTYRAVLAGFTVREVPIVFADRTAGKSKMSARIALEAMLLVPRIRRDAASALARAGRNPPPP
jgi:dolichol-phosphate mannosyltransferase